MSPDEHTSAQQASSNDRSAESGVHLAAQAERARDAIVKSYRIVKVPDYFLDEWLPLLGPSRWLTVLAFRQLAFLHKCKDKTGEKPARTTYRELARWSGQSRPQMHKLLKDPQLLTWFVQADQGELGVHPRSRSERRVYLVRIDVPLTPHDQARLERYLSERLPETDEGWLQVLHGGLEAKSLELPEEMELPKRPRTIQSLVRQLRSPGGPLPEEIDWACDELLERWQTQNFGQVTHYFIKRWLPELTPGLGCLLIWARRHANKPEGDDQVGQLRLSGWGALADAIDVSTKSVRRWFGDPDKYPHTTTFMYPVPIVAGAGRIESIDEGELLVDEQPLDLSPTTLIKDTLQLGDFIALTAEERNGCLQARTLELARETDLSPGFTQSSLFFDVKITEPIHPDDQERYQALLNSEAGIERQLLRSNVDSLTTEAGATKEEAETGVDRPGTKIDKPTTQVAGNGPNRDKSAAKVDNQETKVDSDRTEMESEGPKIDAGGSEVDALRESLSTSQRETQVDKEEQLQLAADRVDSSSDASQRTNVVVLHKEWDLAAILVESAIPNKDKKFILADPEARAGAFMSWLLWSVATKTIDAPAIHAISRVRRGEQPPREYCRVPAFSPIEVASWLAAGAWDAEYPAEVASAVKQLRKADAAERLGEIRALPEFANVGGRKTHYPGRKFQEQPEEKEGYGEIDVPINEKGIIATDAWEAAKGQLRSEIPRASFDTWVNGAELLGYEEGVFIIGVQNQYARDWLDDRLSSTLNRVLMGITGKTARVKIVVG
jgi:hypothetical protein